VALHGAYQQAHCWDLVAPALVDRFRFLAPDLRGHGESDRHPEGAYGLDDFVADLRGLLDLLGLGKVTLLGSSMGARVAFTFAGTEPERVERLVVIGIGPERDTRGVERIRSNNVAEPDEFADEATAWAYYERRYARNDPAYVRNDFAHTFRRLADGRLVRKFDPALRTFSSTYDPEASWATVRRITAPTLIVRGAESDVFSHEVAVRMRDAIAGSRLVELPDVGHLALGERPELLNRELRAFLAD
jgi:pimeloyl-ACP methyl ester carboxylesterase